MTPHDLIDRHPIDWPDWETRYNANPEVRQIPLEQASPAPEAHAPLNHAGRKINTKTFVPQHIGSVPQHARPGRPSPAEYKSPAPSRRPPPIRANKRRPDCEHKASLTGYKHGVDNYGRARKKCKVKQCGRVVLAA